MLAERCRKLGKWLEAAAETRYRRAALLSLRSDSSVMNI
jgi:hypothetical protein